MDKISRLFFAIAGSVTIAVTTPIQAETLRIGGSGVALAAMRHVGENMTAIDPSLQVEVLPSLSTPGGIRAMIAGEIDVLIASRALTADERAKVDGESACFTTALVLATPHKAASGLTKAEIPGYYADAKPMWPDGTPLKVILRLRTSSEAAAIANVVPGFKAAYEAAHQRKGIPVASTDLDNADLALRTAGSISFMTLLQIQSEQLALKPLTLDAGRYHPQPRDHRRQVLPPGLPCLLCCDGRPAAGRGPLAGLCQIAGRAILDAFLRLHALGLGNVHDIWNDVREDRPCRSDHGARYRPVGRPYHSRNFHPPFL